MKLAIMQPYFLPYIGYFQLINAVDRFVFYNDVAFIKQGWINRNRILSNNAAIFFTVPLSGAGSHVLIKNVEINQEFFHGWRHKFLKTVDQNYRKAPYHKIILPLIESVISFDTNKISDFSIFSIKAISTYLAIKTDIVESSTAYNNDHLRSVDRVIDICSKEDAKTYVNASGGSAIYSRDQFASHGIALKFLNSHDIYYKQYNSAFVPWLSIIDVLMFNSPETIHRFLNEYDLV